jgi:hypothetical protein
VRALTQLLAHHDWAARDEPQGCQVLDSAGKENTLGSLNLVEYPQLIGPFDWRNGAAEQRGQEGRSRGRIGGFQAYVTNLLAWISRKKIPAKVLSV